MEKGESDASLLALGAIFVILICGFGLWGCPQYKVYSQTKDGEAVLAHAVSSKEVAALEAKAKLESSKMLADAEIERARGVAESTKIIGKSLQENSEYLTYLWINGLESNNPTIIYVPTEANLPILEAGRIRKMSQMPTPKAEIQDHQ